MKSITICRRFEKDLRSFYLPHYRMAILPIFTRSSIRIPPKTRKPMEFAVPWAGLVGSRHREVASIGFVMYNVLLGIMGS